jgi:hypothetical protein
MRVDHPAVLVQRLISHAHSSVQVAEEALLIAMLRPSNGGDSRNQMEMAEDLSLEPQLHLRQPMLLKHLLHFHLTHRTSNYRRRAYVRSKR